MTIKKDLFDFNIIRKNQFFSIFYQNHYPLSLDNISTVLEFGHGRGTSAAILRHLDLKVTTVDFNKNFSPDFVDTILSFQTTNKFDLVCAFQVLEHNPIETIKENLTKMKSLSNKYVYISIPYSGRWFSLNLEMNFMPTKLGRQKKTFLLTWPRLIRKTRPIEKYKLREDKYNPHWWEVGDKKMTKKDFVKIIVNSGLDVEKTFHNEYFPYHLFYLLKKVD